ncbi:hypothetical protein N665_0119s0065 [Sinapis alba]|nr:hypothetical protein N665_0879s0003 [Sinapis alba]KAF8107602.1 hypothetical protein N665_0119s0065 [Sinapis alba]
MEGPPVWVSVTALVFRLLLPPLSFPISSLGGYGKNFPVLLQDEKGNAEAYCWGLLSGMFLNNFHGVLGPRSFRDWDGSEFRAVSLLCHCSTRRVFLLAA